MNEVMAFNNGLSPAEGDNVTIWTAKEVEDFKKRIREECAAVCEELAETWAKYAQEDVALQRAASEIRKL